MEAISAKPRRRGKANLLTIPHRTAGGRPARLGRPGRRGVDPRETTDTDGRNGRPIIDEPRTW